MLHSPDPTATQERANVNGALLRLVEVVTGHASPDDLLPAVAELAATTLNCFGCLLYLWDKERARFVPAAVYGLPSHRARLFRRFSPSLKDIPIAQQAVDWHRPVVVGKNDARLPASVWHRLGAQRLAGALFLRRDQILGGLVLLRDEEPFDEETIALLEAIARQTALALENAQLRRQAQNRSRHLTEVLAAGHEVRANHDIAAILQRIVKGIQQGLGWRTVLITRYDQETGLAQGVASAGIPTNELERLYSPGPVKSHRALYEREQYRLSRSYFVPAERGGQRIAREPLAWVPPPDDASRTPTQWKPKDFLIIPIRDRQGEALGTISVDRPANGQRPSLADVQALEIFADQAAVALENARLFQSERARRRQMEGLQRTVAALSAELQRDPLLHLIAEQTASIFDAAAAAVLMWDESRQKLVVQAHYGLPNDFARGLCLPYRRILSQLSRAPDPDLFAIQDLEAARRPSSDDASLKELVELGSAASSFRSVLLCALQLGGQLIGALVVYDERPRQFHPDERALARTLAQQAAIAIENAQLYAALQSERERLRALSVQLTQTQEAERTRIARELHDEAGQSLTAVGLQLDFIASLLPPDAPKPVHEQIKEAQALVGRTVEEIRRISVDLRPSLLDDLGLTPALRWQCERLGRHTQLQVEFESQGEARRLTPDVETAVYRAAQEALTNIVRHAQATQARISLDYQAEHLRLIIADNGRGFTDATDRGKGVGLTGMQERIAAVGGALRLDSPPGSGSILTIKVPLTP